MPVFRRQDIFFIHLYVSQPNAGVDSKWAVIFFFFTKKETFMEILLLSLGDLIIVADVLPSKNTRIQS